MLPVCVSVSVSVCARYGVQLSTFNVHQNVENGGPSQFIISSPSAIRLVSTHREIRAPNSSQNFPFPCQNQIPAKRPLAGVTPSGALEWAEPCSGVGLTTGFSRKRRKGQEELSALLVWCGWIWKGVLVKRKDGGYEAK